MATSRGETKQRIESSLLAKDSKESKESVTKIKDLDPQAQEFFLGNHLVPNPENSENTLTINFELDDSINTLKYGWNPILLAIRACNEAAMQALSNCHDLLPLNNNDNVNAMCMPWNPPVGFSEYSLLCYATLRGHLRLVTWLIRSGADVNKLNLDGRTPIFLAALYNYHAIAKILIDHGAHVNLKSNNYRHAAINEISAHRPPETLLLLLKAGADIDAEDDDGQTALDDASVPNSEGLAEEYLNPENRQRIFTTLRAARDLFLLAETNDSKQASEALALTQTLNHRNSSGETPLHVAVRTRNYRMVQFFVANGASIITLDDNGVSPLHLADDTACKSMICGKPDLIRRNEAGQTALDIVAEHQRNSIPLFMNCRQIQQATSLMAMSITSTLSERCAVGKERRIPKEVISDFFAPLFDLKISTTKKSQALVTQACGKGLNKDKPLLDKAAVLFVKDLK